VIRLREITSGARSRSATRNSYIEIPTLPVALRVGINAPSGRRGEGHVFPSSDLHIGKVKGDWLLGREKNVSQVAM
jgi:hypothetical protein